MILGLRLPRAASRGIDLLATRFLYQGISAHMANCSQGAQWGAFNGQSHFRFTPRCVRLGIRVGGSASHGFHEVR
jgi:hypothetical protein